MKVNEIAIARKAIKKALKAGKIEMETSAMDRVAYEAIVGICKSKELAAYLSWEAVKDVKFGY